MKWTVPVFTKPALVFLGSNLFSETVWGWPLSLNSSIFQKMFISPNLDKTLGVILQESRLELKCISHYHNHFVPFWSLILSFTWHTLYTLYCPSQVWTIAQNNSCIANYGLFHLSWKLSVIIQWTWIMTSLWIFIVAYLEMIYGRVLITAKKDTHLAFKLANGLLGHLGQKESAWNLGLRLKLELSGKQLLFWHILQC